MSLLGRRVASMEQGRRSDDGRHVETLGMDLRTRVKRLGGEKSKKESAR